MNLKNLTERSNLKTDLDINISDNGTIENYKPSFGKGDIVILKPKFKQYSKNYSHIVGRELIVKDCKISDLGDMLIETVYFVNTGINNDGDEIVDGDILNPYIAEHFKKVINEKPNTT